MSATVKRVVGFRLCRPQADLNVIAKPGWTVHQFALRFVGEINAHHVGDVGVGDAHALMMWSEITSPICTGGFGRTASLQDACLASCTARLAPSRASQLLGAKRGVIPDHILSGILLSQATGARGFFDRNHQTCFELELVSISQAKVGIRLFQMGTSAT